MAWMGKGRVSYRVLLMEPEGNRQFGRFRNGRVDNNNIHIQDTGCEKVARNVLAQNKDNWRNFIYMGPCIVNRI